MERGASAGVVRKDSHSILCLLILQRETAGSESCLRHADLIGSAAVHPDLSKCGGHFSLWQWMSGAASLLLDIRRGPV